MKIKNLKITPRFNDCDLMGHVNNAIYLTYAEEARIHFFNQLFPKNWNWKKNGIILKKHEIIYLEQIFFSDEIEIESNIIKINTSSFELIHKIFVKNIIKTTILSTLVYFDYNNNHSKKLDDEILNFLKSCQNYS